MPFYLRKSFGFGPVRLNLSKSGITPSVGVRGLRVGKRAGGRPYVHAGRGGVYFRRSLGGGPRPAGAGARPGGDRRILVDDTGHAFDPPPDPTRVGGIEAVERRDAAGGWPVPWAVGTAVAAVLAALGAAPGRWVWAALAAAAAVLLARRVVRGRRRRRAAGALAVALDRVTVPGPLSADARRALERALADPRLADADRRRLAESGYGRVVRDVVRDGRVTADERSLLASLEAVLGLAADAVGRARLGAFQVVYLEAVADHALTAAEERTLGHVRSALALDDGAVAEHAEVVDRLRRLREVRSGALEAVEPPVPLRRGETCWYVAPARFLKERNLRSYQRDGVRTTVRGLVVDREGRLLVTDRRLLLVHDGTSEIRLNRILDIEVDADENLIRVTRDGVASPTFIATPDAVTAGAVLAEAAGV